MSTFELYLLLTVPDLVILATGVVLIGLGFAALGDIKITAHAKKLFIGFYVIATCIGLTLTLIPSNTELALLLDSGNISQVEDGPEGE